MRISRLQGAAAVAVALATAVFPPAASASPQVTSETLRDQVIATERAFAKTMADRDLAAFGRFVSEEAVFLSRTQALRGRDKVLEGWRKLFEGPAPPFSWEPQTVEVLRSGRLAVSSGPVRDSSGQLVATFTSIWRRERPGTWRIVFDSGCDVCAKCDAAADPGH